MQHYIKRRDFLKSAFLGGTGLVTLPDILSRSLLGTQPLYEEDEIHQNTRPPDILFFMTDQQR